MSDARGPVFISYRRDRISETTGLLRALHDRGVPTWRDVDDLAGEPTESTIRATLSNEATSGAILWLTPDIKNSPIIRDVEVPEAVKRFRRDSDFWLIVVLANGLDYSETTTLFSGALGVEDLSTWNLTKVSQPFATEKDLRGIANKALEERLKAARSAGDIEVVFHAKGTRRPSDIETLSVDWTTYYANGIPTGESWTAMASAAGDLSAAVKRVTRPGSRIALSGTVSLPGAVLIGSNFPTRDGALVSWRQRQLSGETLEPWTMTDAADSSAAAAAGWIVDDPVYRDTNAHALAVCINISDDVSDAFARSAATAPDWRAVLKVRSQDQRNTRANPLTAIEAASLVHLTIDAIRGVRAKLSGVDAIHLFIAGPAGYAALLGTMLATLPNVSMWEYDTTTTSYVVAATIVT